MNIFLYIFLLPLICSIPTRNGREALSSVPPSLPNAPRIANHNFEATPVSPLSKEEGGSALHFLEASRKSHTAVHPNSQLLQQRTQITEGTKLSPDPHTFPFSAGNGIQNNPVIKTNPVTKSDYRSRRKVTNTPVDLNPLNFRNAPKDVASKEDWNHISQLLEDGRGTHPAAHPYLRNGQNDWKLVRPVPRDTEIKNSGVSGKLMSEVNNPNAHSQFEYDRKRKVPDNHLFEAVPNTFRPPKDVASKEDWNHISQLLEDGRGTHPAAHPYLRNGQNDWKLMRPVPRDIEIKNPGVSGKLRDNPNAHSQFEYDRKRKVPDNHLFEAVPNTFRQTSINSMPNEHEEYITRVLENFVSNEDWDHYLQLSEAIRGTHSTVSPYWRNAKQDRDHFSNILENVRETHSAAHPHLRNVQNVQAHQPLPLCQECFQISGQIEKGISGDSSLSISKAIISDNRSAIFSKLPRFF
jgi:hypothetical protein